MAFRRRASRGAWRPFCITMARDGAAFFTSRTGDERITPESQTPMESVFVHHHMLRADIVYLLLLEKTSIFAPNWRSPTVRCTRTRMCVSVNRPWIGKTKNLAQGPSREPSVGDKGARSREENAIKQRPREVFRFYEGRRGAGAGTAWQLIVRHCLHGHARDPRAAKS